ncbi:MAG: SUR7/PalI family protein [Eubacterium sp.]|nr:SUR7/PalI family protein [Eubacterium sp.]
MSNCPKCNKKIGAFYFKQNCPHCNANLMYYDFDNRLKEDAAKAEKEWGAVENVINGIKNSTIGSLPAIARLIMFIAPVVALLMPTFRMNDTTINLISMIKQIIASSSDVFGNKALLIGFVTFVVAIAFALVNLVFSLFSFTKNGLKRNLVVSIIGLIAFVGVGIASAMEGVTICTFGGFYVAVVLMAVAIALHTAVDKKIKGNKENENN